LPESQTKVILYLIVDFLEIIAASICSHSLLISFGSGKCKNRVYIVPEEKT